jgi:two-component system, chemotaxis family, protein-glutamate methylesterase/glutaminase
MEPVGRPPPSLRPSTLVVVGASAGGVEALRTLVAGLPPDVDAAVLVVLHVPRGAGSALPAILTRSGSLPASHARHGEPLSRGRVLVAPADHHLLVVDGRVWLSHGPREKGHRPAVDPLFRSAARAWGSRTLGIVLSGSRDDGSTGAAAIAARGGMVVVQDPEEALHGSMPRATAEHVPSALALPAASIGTAVAEWVGSIPPETDNTDLLATEAAVANMAGITTDAALEGALWTALRSLEEKVALSRRMAAAARRHGSGWAAERYDEVSDENESASRLIRSLVEQVSGLTGTSSPEPVP